MGIEIKKKEGETAASLLYRFSKKMKQSGILLEAKKRRFKRRLPNKRKIKESALHKLKKKKDFERSKKLGLAQF